MRRSHARNRVNSIYNSNSNSRSTGGSCSPAKMDQTRFQSRSNTRSPNFFPQISKQSRMSSPLLVASVPATFAILLCCYLFIFSTKDTEKYRIIIDGGSTGTRIHVFRYTVEGGRAVFDFKEDGLVSMRVSPGLSAYAGDPENAGLSVMRLLEFGKGNVPKRLWAETEIRLMATAGLRLLDIGVQEQILESCRRVLSVSGFKFHDEWASVITGSDEGVYAWMVVNYALGTLGGDPLQTTGIIELGGASAQVTFVSSEPMPPEFARTVRFGNSTYNLYSHSFLHFGQNVAFESMRESLISRELELASNSLHDGNEVHADPCSPRGYLHDRESWKMCPGSLPERNEFLSKLQSSGNFSECRSLALMLLQMGKEKCSYNHCNLGSAFMPKLQGKFLATENFFHASKFFELRPRAFLSGLVMAGERFCGEDWSKLKNKYQTVDEEELLHYCFSSAYIVALLHDSLGIALDDERITFANQVKDMPLDWALGAFILQSTADLNVQHQATDWMITIISDDSPTLFSLIAITVLLIFIGWMISKCRKPQLKTVYDLEKGRYFVTRVNRR
ncbi:hypothetical protein SLA2020_026420 [Shorea laevis]